MRVICVGQFTFTGNLDWTAADRRQRRALCRREVAFHLRTVCSGAQRGHGSTLRSQSFTIWCDLRSFPVGIWCQLGQDDARCGHLKVSLDFITSPDTNGDMHMHLVIYKSVFALTVCQMQF